MTRRSSPLLLLVACASLAAGCASSGGPEDPWAPVNRPVFGLNDGVDRYLLGPVAEGYEYVTFEGLRESISRFFFNARFPSRFVSSVGQADGGKAMTEVARFLVNSTAGIGGLFDPATAIGIARYDEDTGQMFGSWGIPPGPYWVIPLLGPSSPRDAVGTVVDTALNPLTWFVPFAGFLNVLNGRAMADDEIENARRTALDYYIFVRDAYTQNRAAAVANEATGGSLSTGPYDDLYDLPDESPSPDADATPR